MPDLDVDSARKQGVAVPPASKNAYLEESRELAPGFIATVDGDEPSLGWTVQHRAGDREVAGGGSAEVKEYIEPGDTLPGQVYLPSQLPDPQAAIQAGMAPQKISPDLVTGNPNHIQGPEPSERAVAEYRDALRAGVLAHREGSAYAGIGDDDGDGIPNDVDETPEGTKSASSGDAPGGARGNGAGASSTSPAGASTS